MILAVLPVDLQVGLFRSDPLRQRRVGLVRATNRLFTETREAGATPRCIWVRRMIDGAGAGPLPDLARGDADQVVVRPKDSAFFGTDLHKLLARLRPDLLVVCGVNTHASIRTTIIDAWQRGYDVRLAVDACASWDREHESITLRYLSHEGIAKVQTIAAIAAEIAGAACRDADVRDRR